MKIPRIQREGSEGIRSGFKDHDQYALDRVNTHMPKIQTSAKQNEDIEEVQPLCADCGSKLFYAEKTQQYFCTYTRCGSVIDAVASTPLTNTDQEMHPFQSQHYDPNNPEADPFFVSFNPDKGDVTVNKGYEVTYTSSDRRVKHIKYKGYPSDVSIDAFDD